MPDASLKISEKVDISPGNDLLFHLGIGIEPIQAALMRAYYTTINTYPDDPFKPPIARGMLFYINVVGEIRSTLFEQFGWNKYDDHNVAFSINPKGNTRIVCKSGDESTGINFMIPKTRNPQKGYVTANMVKNNAQGWLFKEMEPKEEDRLPVATWVLLYRAQENRLQYEISYPKAIADNGQIDDWEYRICFPTLDFDDNMTDVLGSNDEQGYNQTYSAEVIRKNKV